MVGVRIGITCYPTYGGSGAVATELGLELARRGHDIHFVSYASPFRLRGFAERVTFHEVTQLEYPLFEQSSPYALALAVKQHEVAKREQLRQWSDSLEAGDLARWAGRLDPRFPGGGRQRAARAIEVALMTGHALSWWQREARESGMLRPWYIHLTVPREVLHRRLAARVDEMLRAGLVQEVQRQLAAGVAPDAAGLDGIGYREVVAMLEGDLPEGGLSQAILVSTRRYAKRQDTWFRNQLRDAQVWAIDATEAADVIARRIHERWSA